MRCDGVRTKLSDLIRVKHGFAFKGEHFVDEPTSHVLVTPGNFSIGGGFQDTKLKFYRGPVPEDYILRPGDLVVTMTDLSRAADTLGYGAVVPKHHQRVYLHNQRIGLVEVLQPTKVSKAWLQYLMRTPEYRAWVVGSATGSTVKHTSPSRICDFEFDLPTINVQEEAATVLDALEGRIELLRKTNITSESIAQALFKSWFIDFDPVRAKAEGREPEGMDAATAALFPAEFEETMLGFIPKGWKPGRFGDLAELAKGSVNPLNAPDEEFEHYSLPAFDVAQLPILERGETIKSNKTRVPDGAVLQSKLNPHIPRVWWPSRIGERAVCSTEFLPWVAKRGATSELVYCTLTGPSFAEAVRTLVTGTSNSHQRVRPDQVAGIQLVIAPEDISNAFSQVVRPLLSKVGENRLLAKTLAELRDGLLPRLVSGRFSLPETQAQLEETIV